MFKTDFIPFHRLRGMESTLLDGVKVVSVPLFKLFPHIRFFDRTIRRHARAIQSLCEAEGFHPDAIICHFLNPQLPLIAELKHKYPNVTTSLVIHEDPRIIGMRFGRHTGALLGQVDHLGFRFDAMRTRFVDEYGQRPNLFLCPSGVPERFVLNTVPPKRFAAGPLTFCFVGMLIPLKNVEILLQSFHQAFPGKDFRLRIIGEGFLRPKLERLSVDLGLGACVRFEGRITREQVQEVLRDADVFVMVSKPEAFGLVYLEAMAKGCLTIGTRGQGIDGVIVSRENGFLCEASDIESLRATLQEIVVLPRERLLAIAEAARQTAADLSDGKVAHAYLTTLGIHELN
ncbi:MAG: glycosyltransferase [Gemmatimonadaceae bacterium]